MDPIKILTRAWQILWSYRTLWIFGLILALAGASASGRGSNNGVQYERDAGTQQPLPEDMQDAFEEFGQQLEKLFQDQATLFWMAGIFVLFLLSLAVITAIARYVAETAVIRMVDEYEGTGSKMTLREGFRIGWSRTSWHLFLINLLVHLPLILVVMLVAMVVAIVVTMMNRSGQAAPALIAGSIMIVLFIILAAVIVTVVLSLLRNFFWRVSALENVGVRESLRRGYQMARENWKSVGVMWLVMMGLGIAWAIVSIIAAILTLPVVAVTAVIGALVAAIPALVAGGLASLFVNGWLPWVIGIVFALPLFFVIAFSPWLLLGSWQTVFTSTVWTLVYRELKALPALTNGTVPAAAD